MHTPATFITLVVDIMAIAALIYIFFKLKHLKSGKKSKLASSFERFRREKIFRNSLIILALAFLFNSVSVYGTLFYLCSSTTAEVSQMVSHALLFMYILYLMQTTGDVYHHSKIK